MALNPFIPSPDTPSWPSLYNPRDELFQIRRLEPKQLGAIYLTDAGDVFNFTFYWTLIFYFPAFAICGIFAFLNLTFPPSKRSKGPKTTAISPSIPMSHLTPSNRPNYYQTLRSEAGVSLLEPPPSPIPSCRTRPPTRKPKERRSRTLFTLIVLITFLLTGLLGAIISSAVIGFVLFGVYKAGGFYMSTWVPFAWAAVHAFIGILNLYPSVIAWI
ncbi:hypothetical protein E1B28_005843 [Marasmius oreades]|uniref:Integral membrane protein n=1 Tax=Marasmius oreades TaxID=181124 RepID=A0A9P7S659_9AGAR|nr:uncharacterized protein E1B28_005843 [Marasmius oreades]KAG7095053.1 hypothetical protein E1B28_005843 [Marasmius oreades]